MTRTATDRRAEILALFADHPELTVTAMYELTGLGWSVLRVCVAQMEADGVLTSRGERLYGHERRVYRQAPKLVR